MEGNTYLQIGDFILVSEIGKGCFGSVYRAFHRITKKIRAIKLMSWKDIVEKNIGDKVIREEYFQAKMNHKNVIKYKKTLYKHEDFIAFVFEYCNANNLSTFLYDIKLLREMIPERIKQNILKQICEGVLHIHQKRCIHRDLKLQNIMVTFNQFSDKAKNVNSFIEVDEYHLNPNRIIVDKQETKATESILKLNYQYHNLKPLYYLGGLDSTEFDDFCCSAVLKIIDFGFAREEEGIKSYCCNGLSAPPELFFEGNPEFDHKFDIWGIGAIAYYILMNKAPFKIDDGKSIDEAKYKDYQNRLAFNLPVGQKLTVSLELLDFIDRLLVINPDERIGWPKINRHPFLVNDVKHKFNTKVDLRIISSYDISTVDNRGLSLVDVIDKYNEIPNRSGKTLKEMIRDKIRSQYETDFESTDIEMMDSIIKPKTFVLGIEVDDDFLDKCKTETSMMLNKLNK